MKDTIEGNKLIEGFAGIAKLHTNFGEKIDYKNLHYHTSWDWLMPVVKKIEQMEDVDTDNFPLL